MKLIPYVTNRATRKSLPERISLNTVLLSMCSIIVLGGILLSFPTILTYSIRQQQAQSAPTSLDQFPVTVNPQMKMILQNAQVEALLASPNSPFQAQAAAGSVGGVLSNIFETIAIAINETPWYQSIAAVDTHFVTITPGMRKEQVASAFAAQLGWDSAEKKQFMTARTYATLPLPEGSFEPGVYVVNAGSTPTAAQILVNDRFTKDVLSHYSSSTAQMVPPEQALTIASLIERETGGTDDMRTISGIIWNRLFAGMNLQIDATLQYAKAKNTSTWWPQVLPKDKYIKSPYNTYANKGLPPTPIANPSVAAVLAALNPVNTPCLFYFHDKYSEFHCTTTYAEHVALLKKYYGQGK